MLWLNRRVFFVGCVSVILMGCASKYMQYDGDQDIDVVGEYDQMVKVEAIKPANGIKSEAPEGVSDPSKDKAILPPEQTEVELVKQAKKVKKVKKPQIFKATSKAIKKLDLEKGEKLVRLPIIEPSDGFSGRRPIKDPYRVGEKTVLDISYFKVSAGTLSLETKPYVTVNDQKAYHFVMKIKTSSIFSMVYSVDDWAETFLDFNEMTPHSYQLHVKESKQLKEVRTYFDREKKKGHYWERKVTKDDGERKVKKVWDIPDYSQNTLSAFFYLRSFPLNVGKEIKFHVANEGENLIFSGKVIRKEKLDTVVGTLDTVVVKPEFKVDGVFKPVGDIYFWFTDDDQRLLVQLVSEIKIGKIVGKLKSLRR